MREEAQPVGLLLAGGTAGLLRVERLKQRRPVGGRAAGAARARARARAGARRHLLPVGEHLRPVDSLSRRRRPGAGGRRLLLEQAEERRPVGRGGRRGRAAGCGLLLLLELLRDPAELCEKIRPVDSRRRGRAARGGGGARSRWVECAEERGPGVSGGGGGRGRGRGALLLLLREHLHHQLEKSVVSGGWGGGGGGGGGLQQLARGGCGGGPIAAGGGREEGGRGEGGGRGCGVGRGGGAEEQHRSSCCAAQGEEARRGAAPHRFRGRAAAAARRGRRARRRGGHGGCARGFLRCGREASVEVTQDFSTPSHHQSSLLITEGKASSRAFPCESGAAGGERSRSEPAQRPCCSQPRHAFLQAGGSCDASCGDDWTPPCGGCIGNDGSANGHAVTPGPTRGEGVLRPRQRR